MYVIHFVSVLGAELLSVIDSVAEMIERLSWRELGVEKSGREIFFSRRSDRFPGLNGRKEGSVNSMRRLSILPQTKILTNNRQAVRFSREPMFGLPFRKSMSKFLSRKSFGRWKWVRTFSKVYPRGSRVRTRDDSLSWNIPTTLIEPWPHPEKDKKKIRNTMGRLICRFHAPSKPLGLRELHSSAPQLIS